MSSSGLERSPLSYRPAIDSRPPAQTWQAQLAPVAQDSQPMLDLSAPAIVHTKISGQAWMATPRPGLPDATAWSTALAQLLIETLQGLRPIGQLNRWVDDRVLAAMTIQRRRQLTNQRGPLRTRPAVLHSLHVQFPTPVAAEVAAHLILRGRSIALAFRIEEFYGRWLCTAVEFTSVSASVGRSREPS